MANKSYQNMQVESPVDNPQDFYETPVDVAAAVTRLIFLHDPTFNPTRILDPGAGTGRFGQAARDLWPTSWIKGVEYDVDRPWHDAYDGWFNEDFREIFQSRMFKNDDPYDLVIGNPPYGKTDGKKDLKLAEKCIRNGLALLRPGGYLVYLLKTVYTEGQDRMYGLFNESPPLAIYQCGPRIAWRPAVNGKNSNTVAYSVFIWRKGVRLDPVVRWFDYRGGVTVLRCGELEYFSEYARAFFPLRYPGWKVYKDNSQIEAQSRNQVIWSVEAPDGYGCNITATKRETEVDIWRHAHQYLIPDTSGFAIPSLADLLVKSEV